MKLFTSKSLRVLLGIGVLAASSAASAQVSCNGSTQCSGPAVDVIGGLFPSPFGGILVESPDMVNGLPCNGAASGPNVLLPADHQNYKETYATLLTASVAEKDVVIRIDTSESECTVFYARMLN